jgi:uncharacterized spore protein YtfJ
MKTKELLQQLSDRFASDANVKSVYGDPIETQEKTIIPMAKVAYGLGAGGAQGEKNEEEGSAGGGGGGVASKPIGVIEITKEETRFIPVDDWKKKIQWIGIGSLLGILIYRWIR